MLTVEELKNLKVGDWVWIKEPIDYADGFYIKIHGIDSDILFDTEAIVYKLTDYGTKWIAYKNKEEAEGKSITLPYLLCTSRKFACVIWRDCCGKVQKTYTMSIDEAKAILKTKSEG